MFGRVKLEDFFLHMTEAQNRNLIEGRLLSFAYDFGITKIAMLLSWS